VAVGVAVPFEQDVNRVVGIHTGGCQYSLLSGGKHPPRQAPGHEMNEIDVVNTEVLKHVRPARPRGEELEGMEIRWLYSTDT
jgi:hypothetical protein